MVARLDGGTLSSDAGGTAVAGNSYTEAGCGFSALKILSKILTNSAHPQLLHCCSAALRHPEQLSLWRSVQVTLYRPSGLVLGDVQVSHLDTGVITIPAV